MSEKVRVFQLQWDNSKYLISPQERYKKRDAIGVQFATGIVSLDNGSVFSNMDELEHHLSLAGKYEVVYQDEQKEMAG